MRLTPLQKAQRNAWKNPEPPKATKQQILDFFDDKGNFRNHYDPYRRSDEEIENDVFFDKDGWPVKELVDRAEHLATTRNLDYFCAAIRLLHACEFSRATKGNYSPCYMWRR